MLTGQEQRAEIPGPFCSYRCTFCNEHTTRLDPCRFHPIRQDFVGDPDERTVLCHP